MKADSYIVIQSWMVDKLHLKGQELLVYAIIHGYSRGDAWFTGAASYIAEWLQSDKKQVLKTLKSMCNKGLLIRKTVSQNAVQYRCVVPNRGCENHTIGGVEITPQGCENHTIGGVEITPNKDIYKDTNKDNYKDTLSNAWEEKLIDSRLSRIVRLFEAELGISIPPSAATEVHEWIDRAGEDIVSEAIREAAANNKKSWAYIRAILKRCTKEGRRPGEGCGKSADPFAEYIRRCELNDRQGSGIVFEQSEELLALPWDGQDS